MLFLASSLLTACVIPPSQSLSPRQNLAVTAPRNCPNCIADLKAVPGTRLIDLKVETNNPSLPIVYIIEPLNTENFRNKFSVSRGSFNGVMQVPAGVDIYLTADYDHNTYTLIGGTTIPSNARSATINLKTILTSEILRDEFKKLTPNQKKNLMKVVNFYSVAINSPKMLFSSKLAEAEGEANNFYVNMPKGFKSTEMHSSLDSIRSNMRLIDIQSKYDTSNGVFGVDNVRKELSNFDRAFREGL